MNKRHITPGMMSGMGPTYPNGGNSGNPNFMNRPASGRPQHQPTPGMGGGNGGKRASQPRHPGMPPNGRGGPGMGGGRMPVQPRSQPVRLTQPQQHRPPTQPQPQPSRPQQPRRNPENDKLRYLLVYHSNVQQSVNFRDKVMKSPVFQKITIKPVDANDPNIRRNLTSQVKNVPTLVGSQGGHKTYIHPHQVEEWLRKANEKYGSGGELPGYEADPFSDHFCELVDSTMTLDPTTGTKIHHKNDRFVSFDQSDTLIIDPHDPNATAPTRDPPRKGGGLKRPELSNKFSADQFNELQKEYEQKRSIPSIGHKSHAPPPGTNFPEPMETRAQSADMSQLMNQYQMNRDRDIPKPPDRTGGGGGPPGGPDRMGPGGGGGNLPPTGMNFNMGDFGNHNVNTRFEELSKQYK